jgi:hypothetical protein
VPGVTCQVLVTEAGGVVKSITGEPFVLQMGQGEWLSGLQDCVAGAQAKHCDDDDDDDDDDDGGRDDNDDDDDESQMVSDLTACFNLARCVWDGMYSIGLVLFPPFSSQGTVCVGTRRSWRRWWRPSRARTGRCGQTG